jgi:hypothetical protein
MLRCVCVCEREREREREREKERKRERERECVCLCLCVVIRRCVEASLYAYACIPMCQCACVPACLCACVRLQTKKKKQCHGSFLRFPRSFAKCKSRAKSTSSLQVFPQVRKQMTLNIADPHLFHCALFVFTECGLYGVCEHGVCGCFHGYQV